MRAERAARKKRSIRICCSRDSLVRVISAQTENRNVSLYSEHFATHAKSRTVLCFSDSSKLGSAFQCQRKMSAGEEKMNDDGCKQEDGSEAVRATSANKIKRFFLSRFKSKDPDPATASGCRRRTSSVGRDEDDMKSRKKSVLRYPGIESEPKSMPNL